MEVIKRIIEKKSKPSIIKGYTKGAPKNGYKQF